jgi:predicted MFS family arabinose efflux permease
MTKAPRPKSLALGGLIALAVAMGIGRFIYTPILPFMLAALPLTEKEAGFIASANFAGYLLGALLASARALPGSRRFWLLTGLAASAVSTIAVGASTALGTIVLLRFVGGVASAFVLVFASTLVLERLAAMQRGGLSALHFAGVGAGIAFSSVLVSGLAGAGYDWRWLWVVPGVAAIGATLLVAYLVPDQSEPPAAPKAGARNKGLVPVVAAYGLFGFGYVITATFLVAMVRAAPEVRHLEPMIWILVGLAAVPSVSFWTWTGVRLGLRPAFAIACAVEALGVAASVLWLTPIGAIVAATLLGGTFMGLTALGLVVGRIQAGGDPRQIFAVMTAAFGLGQIVGPAVAGLLYDATGSFLSSSLLAVAALAVAAGLIFVERRA